jgi:hypothetical protein
METQEMMKQKRLRDQEVIAKFRQQGTEEGRKGIEPLLELGSKGKDSEHFINYFPSDYHTETG